MNYLISIVNFIFSFKAYVMLPIIILILGLIIRMKVLDAFMSALKLGVGFAGIFIVFDFFVKNIGPAVKSIVENRGLDFPVLDVGWPPLAAITWASKIAPITIALILVINIIMILTNTTKMINLDIWNYWHYALIGALIQKTSESFILGLTATAVIGIYGIKLSEWSAPFVKKEGGLDGICISPLSVSGLLPLGIIGNKLFDLIPGIKKLKFNPNEKKEKIGFIEILSQPMIIGIFVGLFLSIMAKYDIKTSLELCIHIAAVMYILPFCGDLLGKGMEPVSLKLKNSIQKIFPKKTNLYIGMDSWVLMKNNSVIITGLILMPISIGIAFILPGNKLIPLGDLANLISVMSLIVLAVNSNVIRAVFIGIPVIIGYMLIATNLAPLFTKLSSEVGVTFENNYDGLITAFTDGGNPIRYWFFYMFKGNIIALAIIPVVLFLLFITWKVYKNKIEELENTDTDTNIE